MAMSVAGLTIGQEMVEGLENAITDWNFKGKQNPLLKMASKLSKLGSFLGGFGGVMELLGLFETSPEVQRLDHVVEMLNSGFQRIEGRFDDVEEKIKNLENSLTLKMKRSK